ncbi:hypothetical protein WJX77_008352 [Trebouxia sp. C0004]
MSTALVAQKVWLHSQIRHGPVKAYRLATAKKVSTLQKAWHLQHVTVRGLVQASQHQQLITSDPATASSFDTDTIAAVVTGAQQGSVAIIRMSGPDAVLIASSVFVPTSSKKQWMPKTHRVYHGHVLDAEGGIVDEVLLLSMLAPKSYTSEDVIELHCHGGGVCVQRVLGCCLREGARLAKPGEFTLRAFLNGRLDLSQAESVNELVGARTVAAADSALAGLTGGIGATVQRLRLSALTLLAELEAMIDFEEDVPVTDAQRLQKQVQAIMSGVKEALDTASKGRLLQAGLQVALVGRPNVGKSSLLNVWSGTDKAIVTQVAGTTRDIVQADVVVAGVPVSLLDTAGMREAADVVERLGVERSRAAARSADIAVMVLDAQVGWTRDDQVIFDHLWGRAVPGNKPAIAAPSILVWNKVDLVAPIASELQSQSPLLTASPETRQSSAAKAASSSMQGGSAGDVAAARYTGPQSKEQHHITSQTTIGVLSTPHNGFSAQPQDSSSAGDAQPNSEAQPQMPTTWANASNADSRPGSDTVESSPDDLAGLSSLAAAPTAADFTASATQRASQASSQSNSDLSAAPAAVSTSSSDQSAFGDQVSAVHGIPSSCADAFAACVETCATTGLGLDALSAALLQLSDAPSLAAGGVSWAVNSRQTEALIRAQEALSAVTDSISEGLPIDFWTIDLRSAVAALGEISGDDVTEEVLDSVFSQFCIGK